MTLVVSYMNTCTNNYCAGCIGRSIGEIFFLLTLHGQVSVCVCVRAVCGSTKNIILFTTLSCGQSCSWVNNVVRAEVLC